MINFEQLTIIIVSFKLNEKLLEKILKDLSPKFKVIIIETHDWMYPETSISKSFFKQISASMEKYNRDIIIKGENLISIRY